MVTAFTVSELLRQNQQGGKITPLWVTLILTRIGRLVLFKMATFEWFD